MKLKWKKAIVFSIIFVIFVLISYNLLTKQQKIPHGLLLLSGRIEGRETNISPKIQGRILKLYKDEGDKVKAGELLCEIDSEQLNARYKAAYETAEASYSAIAQAKANFMKANAYYERAKKMTLNVTVACLRKNLYQKASLTE